jgi:quinol monooxygenase YgiN
MSISKQRLFIARNKKASELEKMLMILKEYVLKEQGCEHFEIYQSEDDKNEFLVYEQWNSSQSMDDYKEQGFYKTFQKQSVPLILKEHFLNLE